jgi:hypothetical protein
MVVSRAAAPATPLTVPSVRKAHDPPANRRTHLQFEIEFC